MKQHIITNFSQPIPLFSDNKYILNYSKYSIDSSTLLGPNTLSYKLNLINKSNNIVVVYIYNDQDELEAPTQAVLGEDNSDLLVLYLTHTEFFDNLDWHLNLIHLPTSPEFVIHIFMEHEWSNITNSFSQKNYLLADNDEYNILLIFHTS